MSSSRSVIVFVFLNTVLELSARTDSLEIFPTLKREVQFSKLDVRSANESLVTVTDYGVKKTRDGQTLYVHMFNKVDFSNNMGTCNVYKCKDSYVDCENVVSYDITDVCTKKYEFINFFTKTDGAKSTQASHRCSVGEHNYDNMTFSADVFGTFFGLPMEKWWERYWIFKMEIFAPDRSPIMSSTTHFYFIQYRGRNRNRSPPSVSTKH